MRVPIHIRVNGRVHALNVEAHHTLLAVLRDQLRLTGSKQCCSEGECGACTVLIGGRSVDSCLVFAAEMDGEDITTIEGLAGKERLDPLQSEFVKQGAVQCGFCIPGMIMSAKALLTLNPHPTTPEIQEGIAGNLCRCAAYSKIVDAIKMAAQTKDV